MRGAAAVIDTNVVVAGLLTGEQDSPTARILDGMRVAAFPYLLSPDLLAEYRKVLLRPKIRVLHGLSEREVDQLLTSIAANAIMREPPARPGAPDTGDDHLWALVQEDPGGILVTGDLASRRDPPPNTAVLSPAEFVKAFARKGRSRS